MAAAMEHYQLDFPDFIEEEHPYIDAEALYHILLPTPVPYDVAYDKGQ